MRCAFTDHTDILAFLSWCVSLPMCMYTLDLNKIGEVFLLLNINFVFCNIILIMIFANKVMVEIKYLM